MYHPVLKSYPGYFLSICNAEFHCFFSKPLGGFIYERKEGSLDDLRFKKKKNAIGNSASRTFHLQWKVGWPL